jgi:hypothetical protein
VAILEESCPFGEEEVPTGGADDPLDHGDKGDIHASSIGDTGVKVKHYARKNSI